MNGAEFALFDQTFISMWLESGYNGLDVKQFKIENRFILIIFDTGQR